MAIFENTDLDLWLELSGCREFRFSRIGQERGQQIIWAIWLCE